MGRWSSSGFVGWFIAILLTRSNPEGNWSVESFLTAADRPVKKRRPPQDANGCRLVRCDVRSGASRQQNCYNFSRLAQYDFRYGSAMPSDPNIALNPMPGRGSPAAATPVPSFGMLPRGSVLQRVKSNFAECITASPRGITPWQFAIMFRSAYFPKRFPTRPLLQSIFLHVCVLTYLTSGPPTPGPRRFADEVNTARAEHRLIYYARVDRLPPVSPLEPKPSPQPQSPRVRLRVARGPERVVSRPPRPDNSRQTIVQPEAMPGLA